MRITLMFCTYRRPALLRRALASVAVLDGLDRAAIDVVVVDNSDEESAADTVAAFAAAAPFPVRYVTAHPANISVARNAAVAAATGEIAVFLDDDMEIEPGWLPAVLETLARSDRDVYFGPVEADFEGEGTPSAAALTMFDRKTTLGAGDELFAMGPRKTPGFALATSNSIFRRARTLTDPEPFDAVLGQCGGEDYDLFCRLQRRGRRFGYIPGARAREFVPAHRDDVDYLARRHYAGGQAFAFSVVRNSENPVATALALRFRTAVQFVLFAFSSPFMERGERRIKLAALKGKWSWRNLYPLYRVEDEDLSGD
ncbi:glycosyltransferase [Ancylobacter sp. A5.8]|uniref:glycosyltransferase family 2 protein n=1 Tax=Ancylobacter gelatini TaxID=2919920 RepID=UPI001F4E1D0C|nr:glycosyltransferase [Ancylobacter gelatini]MCJ8141350.1 glycosyltransferase [Ancylobacter gelatini]